MSRVLWRDWVIFYPRKEYHADGSFQVIRIMKPWRGYATTSIQQKHIQTWRLKKSNRCTGLYLFNNLADIGEEFLLASAALSANSSSCCWNYWFFVDLGKNFCFGFANSNSSEDLKKLSNCSGIQDSLICKNIYPCWIKLPRFSCMMVPEFLET